VKVEHGHANQSLLVSKWIKILLLEWRLGGLFIVTLRSCARGRLNRPSPYSLAFIFPFLRSQLNCNHKQVEMFLAQDAMIY
jgi:hypothetical protein